MWLKGVDLKTAKFLIQVGVSPTKVGDIDFDTQGYNLSPPPTPFYIYILPFYCLLYLFISAFELAFWLGYSGGLKIKGVGALASRKVIIIIIIIPQLKEKICGLEVHISSG